MTPFLILGLGIPAPTAIGTDLVFATLTKMAGSFQHYRQSTVKLEVALFLGLGSIPASLLGVSTLEWIEATYDPQRVRMIVTAIIASMLVLVGASLVFRIFMRGDASALVKGGWDGVSRMSLRRRLFTVLFGAAGGYLVGLTSIGSGSVMTVILLLLYPLSPAVVVGTDIFHATVLSLVTGVAHAASGNVDFSLAGVLLLGGIPGVLIGSRVAPRLPVRYLRLVLACVLVFIGVLILAT